MLHSVSAIVIVALAFDHIEPGLAQACIRSGDDAGPIVITGLRRICVEIIVGSDIRRREATGIEILVPEVLKFLGANRRDARHHCNSFARRKLHDFTGRQ